MKRMRRPINRLMAVGLLLAASLTSGCGSETEPSSIRVHGDPLVAADKPDPDGCEIRLRAEQVAAQRIRQELRVDGIRTDPVAVKAAAADPATSTAALGIPLSPSEVEALQTSGIAIDATSAMGFWVNAGAPERFGGIWIDPPGSNRYVVAVVAGDPESLALARCFEGPDTRYVWANLSIADGRALATRIANDMQAMRAAGIEVNTVNYQENEGTVIVGVTHPTAELERTLIERYGGPLRLEQQAPVIPL